MPELVTVEAASGQASPGALLTALAPHLRCDPAWTLLIDGGSGSGKSTLADWLGLQLRAPVLRMEGLYAGWSGLAGAAELLGGTLLPNRSAGRAVRVPQWDWHADRWGDPAVLRPGRPLIVEGCGSLTAASRRHATLAVWLDVPRAERERRTTARDPASTWPALRRWRHDELHAQARFDQLCQADILLRGGVRLSPLE